MTATYTDIEIDADYVPQAGDRVVRRSSEWCGLINTSHSVQDLIAAFPSRFYFIRRPIPPAQAEPTPTATGDARYLALLDEMRALHIRKSADYGRGDDPLANIRASEELGVPAWKGAMVRALDKVHRIKSYCQNGSLANEGVEDALLDLSSHALLALVLFREGKVTT